MSSNLHIEYPDLTALISLIKNELKREINCVSVGTINSFDSTNQTANVTINYKKVLKKKSAIGTKEYNDVIIEYPMLLKCPVLVLNGGGAHITFPIRSGDDCVVLFCDRDIDLWLEKGYKNNPPGSERMHDLSDAIAIVGINSLKDSIGSYDADKLKIKYGNGYITIDDSGSINVQGSSIIINGTTVNINP